MKKTVFEGIVNDVKYDSVEGYNKAIQEAIANGGDVKASSKTEIVDEPAEEHPLKKLPTDLEELLSLGQLDLEHQLIELKKSFANGSDVYKNNSVQVLEKLQQLTKRLKEELVSGIDALEAQMGEIDQQTEKLEKQCEALEAQMEKLDRQYDMLDGEADNKSSLYRKVCMIEEYFDEIIKKDPQSIWKKIFGE